MVTIIKFWKTDNFFFFFVFFRDLERIGLAASSLVIFIKFAMWKSVLVNRKPHLL